MQGLQNIKKWNRKKYKDFVEFLKSLQDKKYKDFSSSLILNSKYEMIGIRTPIMRNIAKTIAKGNIEEFLKCVQDNYYEEIMIQGFVISHIKDEEVFYNYFRKHITKIDCWGLCDSFCSSLKIVRKYEDKYFQESLKMALKKEEFISRIGLIIILDHFIRKENLNAIFETLNKIQSDKFYINMAEAWLVCELYIKYPNETNEFIKKNNLNKFTQNKAIRKIRDSYRVSKEEKELLNAFKK